MTDVRELERASIRDFVTSCAPLLTGRTLDLGCGLSPYRDLVTGDYLGYDRDDLPGHVSGGPNLVDMPPGPYDAILCTQVVQYVPDVPALLNRCHTYLGRHSRVHHGHLILTGPTCWPEVEPTDLHRFTRAGIARLLVSAGFTVLRLEHRAHVEAHGARFPLGWGAVAYA